MRTMLIWSNGSEINTHIFEDKDGKTGHELAVEEMHKEYDKHNRYNDASEEYGAYRENDSCVYAAEYQEECSWKIIDLPQKEIAAPVTEYSDACNTLGTLIDCVEDFLEEKGVTPEMIPNDEREENPESALIFCDDYDELADKFSTVLGISRNADDYGENFTKNFVRTLPKEIIYEAYRRQQILYRIDDVLNHADDMGAELSESEAEMVAGRFLDNHDCNVAENDAFRELIRDYTKERAAIEAQSVVTTIL